MKSWLASLSLALAAGPMSAGAAGGYAALVQLAEDWRHFEKPTVSHCIPEYTASATAAKARQLPAYQARLAAIDTKSWPAAHTIDYLLVRAEMDGLDFDLRIRRPWARDPSFYATLMNCAPSNLFPAHSSCRSTGAIS